jgi:hypothetical protein
MELFLYRRRAEYLGTDLKSRKGLYSGPFPSLSRAGIFSLLEIVTGWLVPSAGQKTQYSMAGTFPLAENRFL